MSKRIKDLMVSLTEYAVVDEDATIVDALKALDESQKHIPPGRQPHRAVLVRNRSGAIVGKLHHFAFLRALLHKSASLSEHRMLDRAGVSDDVLRDSMRALDFLTEDLLDVCERARNVLVRHVYTSTNASIDENAPLVSAVHKFLTHQTLSLLVLRDREPVGVLRLSDLFQELAREMVRDDCVGKGM